MNPQEARFAYALRGADVARVAEGVDALFADQLDRTVQKVAIPISPVRIEADGVDVRWCLWMDSISIIFFYIYIYIHT